MPIILRPDGDKAVCAACTLTKPVSDFYVRKDSGRRRSECKPCYARRTTKWFKENPDRRKAIANKYARANRHKSAAWKAKTRLIDPDKVNKWSIDHPERHEAARKRWNKNNRHKNNARAVKRYALKLQAVPKWANLKAIDEIYKTAADAGHEVDHIVPLQSKIVCGLHVEANLRAIPMSENRRKSNRWWPDMP